MDKSDFSLQFDILYNNETSNQAPNLNGYEKSVFLTKAEDEVLKNYFRKTGNSHREGFDDSGKRQVDFSLLIKTVSSNDIENAKLPDDAFVVLRESIKEDNIKKTVIPISNEEYIRIQSKPYKRPLKSQIWRLIINANSNNLEFVKHNDTSVLSDYSITYLRKPNPIIVYDSTEYLSNGYPLLGGYPEEKQINSNVTYVFCDIDIPEELHQEILQRAVELAKAAWLGDLNATLQIGQRSE